MRVSIFFVLFCLVSTSCSEYPSSRITDHQLTDQSGAVVYGVTGTDVGADIAVHPFGHLAITGGNTAGNLFAGLIGSEDGWVMGINTADESSIWNDQFGRLGKATAVGAVNIDFPGNVYVGGSSPDLLLPQGFVRAYNLSGSFRWETAIDSAHGGVTGVGTDCDGNIYAASIAAPDSLQLLITKLDSNGAIVQRNITDLGAKSVISTNDLTVSCEGDVYIVGSVPGGTGLSSSESHKYGHYDAFTMKFDKDLNEKWRKYFRSSKDDYFLSVDLPGYRKTLAKSPIFTALGDRNNRISTAGISPNDRDVIFICGYTEGNLVSINNGDADFVVMKLNSNTGDVILSTQNGSSRHDQLSGIAVSYWGDTVYTVGYTRGDLFAPFGGGIKDPIWIKYNTNSPSIPLVQKQYINPDDAEEFVAISVDVGNISHVIGSIINFPPMSIDITISKLDPFGNLIY